MLMMAGLFSVCAIICYILCFNLTTERVVIPAKTEKFEPVALFKRIFTSRSLLGIILAALCLLLTMLFTSRSLLGIILAALCLLLTMLTMTGMNPYIFPYYFKNTAAQSAVAMCSSFASLLVVAPLATMLASKIGKKETAIIGSLFGAIVYLVCFILHPESGWVYLGFYTGIYTIACVAPIVGFTVIALVLWFVYPLSKKVVDGNVETLKARRTNRK